MLTEGALRAAQRVWPAPSTMLRMVPLPVPGRIEEVLRIRPLIGLDDAADDRVADDVVRREADH